MNGSFEVKKNGKVIGTAEIGQQGLYCHIRCRCRLEGTGMQRLSMAVGKRVIDLGILVPMSGEFGMDTRIAAKRLPEGIPEFWVGERARREAAPEEPMREAPVAEIQPAPAAEVTVETPMPAEQPSAEAVSQEAPPEGPFEEASIAGEMATEAPAMEAPLADEAAFAESPALEEAVTEGSAQETPAEMPTAEEVPAEAPAEEEAPPEAEMVFHPVAEDAPFGQLSRLPEAVLAMEGEQIGVAFPAE